MSADADLQARAEALVAACPQPAGALLPLLELVLAERGGCDAEAAAWIAVLTGLAPAFVLGVASTRGDAPQAGETARVCTGLSCQWMGAAEVLADLERRGVAAVAVDCLGACSAAPVLARAGRLHDGLTPERIAALVGAAQ